MNRERNEAICARIDAGEADASDLVEPNFSLVRSFVNQRINLQPVTEEFKDDLEQAGFIALLKCVDDITNGERPDDIVKFLGSEISKAIQREAYNLLPRDNQITLANHHTLDETTELERNCSDTEAAIEAACIDELDKQIIALRKDSDSKLTIAAKLGVAKETVSDRLKSIEARLYGKTPLPQRSDNAA